MHSPYRADASYARLAELPLAIESLGLEGLEVEVSSEFTRLTTVIRLSGGGHDGVGEDVTYDALDQIALRDASGDLDLAGTFTVDSFSQRLDEVELWPSPPVREPSRDYRRWAFESAALDLALRQANLSLAEALGLEPRPVRFVVSLRLGNPPATARVLELLGALPGTRFKLDPTNDWTPALVEELASTGAVDVLDLKGFYRGTPVDVVTDPSLYRMVAEAFPDAWIEDPDLNEETDPILEPHRERITWDAPIHSVADIDGLPFPPRMVNVKPSRFGSLRGLMAAYDHCREHGIGLYGGGQFELGPGRGHIQYLASLFHPDAPNDTAPTEYNIHTPAERLPTSPLEARIDPTGFRWAG